LAHASPKKRSKFCAEKVPEASVIEHALSHILPHLLSEAIKEHKLTLAVYPKFELVSAKEGEDWQVRALTCEVPTFELGDYKKNISGEIASRQVGAKKDLSPEEKEQSVIKALLTGIKLEIPKLLIEEEVNSRLSNLLGRVEKLGLNLEPWNNPTDSPKKGDINEECSNPKCHDC